VAAAGQILMAVNSQPTPPRRARPRPGTFRQRQADRGGQPRRTSRKPP